MMNKKKNVKFLAVVALSTALMAGQVSVASAQETSAAVSVSSIIPDNVTIDSPVSLSQISLPGNQYGTLSWVNSSSVPTERVQSYQVVFTPYNSSDLAKISGWDGQSSVIYSSVTVVVNSISNEASEEYVEDQPSEESAEKESYSEDVSEEQNSEPTEANPKEENAKEDIAEDKVSVTEIPEESKEDTATEEKEEIKAEVTATPEVTKAAEESKDDTEAEEKEENKAEITATPEVTEAAEESKEDAQTEEKEPEVTAAPEATAAPEVTAAPEATESPEDNKEEGNIFDTDDSDFENDDRESAYDKDYTDEEKIEMAEENHTCNGISVSGNGLPWYVQFRVSTGVDYQFSNEENAKVYKTYEFELWDLKNDCEYKIPDGEYISVTVPVKAGYKYTIEHLLDNGALETIVPSVDGNTMVFSTHSFSPFSIAGFSIAGSTSVVNDMESNVYDSDTTANTSTDSGTTTTSTIVTATPTPSASTSQSSQTASSTSDSSESEEIVSSDTSAETASSTSAEDTTEADSQSNSVESVHTGDNTPILPFVLLGIAAVAIIAVIVYLRKRNNK